MIILLHASAKKKKRKKRLNGLKFRTIIGRFQATPWQ